MRSRSLTAGSRLRIVMLLTSALLFVINPAVPNRRNQIVLADRPLAMVHEICQQIERLGFEVDQRATAPQLATVEVEPAIIERVNHLRLPGAGRPPSTTKKEDNREPQKSHP
jgi:hypothetical protein